MSEPFLAEIRIFAGNFAPRGWALCNGQILSIQQNTALFSLLGTTYGGNGISNFALPNLQGSAPIQQGQGPGLSPRVLGETGGETAVTLLAGQMPAHSHAPKCNAGAGTQASPSNEFWSESGVRGVKMYTASNASLVQMNPQALPTAGGNQPHNNMPPYLVLNFIIALVGIFPARN